MSKTVTKKAASKKATAVKKTAPTKKAEAVKKAPAAPAKTKKAAPVAKKAAVPAKKVKQAVKPAAKKTIAAQKVDNKNDSGKIKSSKPVSVKKVPVKATDTTRRTNIIKKTEPKTTALKIEEYRATFQSESSRKEEVTPSPAFRYSDEELNEFRELILGRLEVGREELRYMQRQMIGKDGTGEEDNSDRRLSLEDGSGAMDREQLSLLASRQLLFINNLEKALIRIMNKTYGICRETGKLIDKARLRAVPHATLSMEAKTKTKVK